MKIAFVVDDSLDYPDGVQQYVITIGTWLNNQGHEVHYITSTTVRNDIQNLHVLTKNFQVSFNGNVLRTPRPLSKQKARAFLRKHAFDILHVQTPYSPLFAGRLAQSAPDETTVVGTFHIAPYTSHEAFLARMIAASTRRSQKKFTSFCSVSSTAQDFAKNAYNLDSEIIPNAVDISRFKNIHSKLRGNTKVTIAFLGRLVERKGCIWFLKSINQLAEDDTVRSVVSVRVAGRGPLLISMKEYVAKHRLTDIVSFDGFIDEADKPSYLARADIAVFPSLSGESFGIVLIEAMAAGGPVVIGGDNEGYRTVMGSGSSQLINPTDTKAFTSILKKFVQDTTARKKAVSLQDEIVKHYDISVVGAHILNFYKTASAHKNKAG
ncbi:phosphatidyl-myo-inositol alpha-mannosyltransferase [soil metagenome]